MSENASFPLTPEQFEKLVELILSGGSRQAMLAVSKNSQEIESAKNVFEARKKAARDVLVGPS